MVRPEERFVGPADGAVVRVTFTGDSDHEVTLAVRNAHGSDAIASTVRVNRRPVARIEPGAAAIVGTTVTLDGRASHDPDGDPIEHRFEVVEAPLGSTSALNAGDDGTATLELDRVGDYLVELTVADEWNRSDPVRARLIARPLELAPPALALEVTPRTADGGTSVRICASGGQSPSR